MSATAPELPFNPRERLRALLSDPERAWIPQPGGRLSLSDTWAPGGADEFEAGEERALLAQTFAHWEARLEACARSLALGQAVHGLGNSLTPVLCEETAASLTGEERSLLGWRAEVLRALAGVGAPTTACRADPFLRFVARALEPVGIDVRIEPRGLGGRCLAPEQDLRVDVLSCVLAGQVARREREARGELVLSLELAEGRLVLLLEAPAWTLFPRLAAAQLDRDPERSLLRLPLARPWLLWVGSAPTRADRLGELGIDLVVLSDAGQLAPALASPPPGGARRPLGVVLGGPVATHRAWRRAVLVADPELARVCHPARAWPASGPETADIAAWCAQAGGP